MIGKESSAGLEHYSTASEGIGGSIKRRISDFKVCEINPAGKACTIEAFAEEGEKKEIRKKWPKEPEGLPRGEGEQLILTMEKFNLDVNDAIRRIARFLQTSKKRVGYAGMKDKRAITAQRITLWKPDYERVKSFDSRYIDLRDAEWGNDKMRLGDLQGNEFEITIREIGLEKKEVEKRVKECFKQMKNGIANYFGEQRFGGIRMVTHIVGREFVRGNMEDGIMIYLTATVPGEEEDVKKARIALGKTRDFSQASKDFPVKYRYERAIIHHLCKYPNDFVGAFRKLPRALCYLFTHAYQSYLFNLIINKRIESGIGLGKINEDVLIDGLPTAPLFGFESKFAEGRIGKIERMVLEEEGITLAQFKVKEMPEISSKGARKNIALYPEKMKLHGVADDEFNTGKLKAVISFRLTKGNYATTVLRELMKNEA
ncbi:MAG: tRNA pseudouridine(13) synthase TruD [Candidatus Diapherotrites archaeon]